MSAPRSVWTDDRLVTLRSLRDAGIPNGAIVELMGLTSTNTISHGLRAGNMPKRAPVPSPSTWRPHLKELRRVLADHPDWGYKRVGQHFGCSKNAIAGVIWRNELKPRPAPRATPVIKFPEGGCLWPHGHPGEADFHFCGARPLPGKPYCGVHAAVAYVRPKEREDGGIALKPRQPR